MLSGICISYCSVAPIALHISAIRVLAFVLSKEGELVSTTDNDFIIWTVVMVTHDLLQTSVLYNVYEQIHK